MPRIVSLQPGATSSADLGHVAYQFELGATGWRNIPSFSLLYRYPFYTAPGTFRADGQPWLFSTSTLTLARVQVPIAESLEALTRVTEVSLDGGSLEADVARMTEAYQLFKNDNRVRADRLDEAIKASAVVVQAYWSLRQWLAAGMTEKHEIDVVHTKLVCLP